MQNWIGERRITYSKLNLAAPSQYAHGLPSQPIDSTSENRGNELRSTGPREDGRATKVRIYSPFSEDEGFAAVENEGSAAATATENARSAATGEEGGQSGGPGTVGRQGTISCFEDQLSWTHMS